MKSNKREELADDIYNKFNRFCNVNENCKKCKYYKYESSCYIPFTLDYLHKKGVKL